MLHADFRRGALRPSDVVEAWLARPLPDRSAPIWIATTSAAALRERARALDALLAADPAAALARPLFGALYAVKDNIDVAGLPTTAACPAFTYDPVASAPVVSALDAAGAILVGKTNLDQFATGLVGTRSPYGAVPNAFDPAFVSGGSSSGSAVAVARGFVHFALGTDTAGSGRVPAGLNNIVGWKPTREFISTEGVVPACRSLDCVSIFALTVADAARVFAVAHTTAGATELRACALDRPFLHGPFRLAVPRHEQLEFFGDNDNAALFAYGVARLEGLGATTQAIDFAPLRAVAAMLYEGAHVAERHAGIRAFFDAHAEALDPTVRGIVANAHGYSATDVFAATATVANMKAQLDAMWDHVDVLAVPTIPTTYTIAAVNADPVELNRRLGTYTNFVNLLDLAAIAVPAGFRADGMPMGVTLIGPAGSDLMLAELAQRLHAAAGLPLGALGLPLPPAETLVVRADLARVAVVGAHLTGLPLNRELTARGARLVRRASTAPRYRLFALPGTTPPKPGMVRTSGDGHAIELEVWELSLAAFGAFVAGVPSPLSIGTIELDDGEPVHGFLCEAVATTGAEDISRFGGWRRYLASRAAS
jgi:allophanate hydrolase